jgi:eukaryotic translation initiation factor 2C
MVPFNTNFLQLASVPLKIEDSMLRIAAHRLQYPKIEYGDKISHTIEDAEAKWNLADKTFLSTKERNIFYKVFHDSHVSQSRIKEINDNFGRQLRDRDVGEPICDENHDIHSIVFRNDSQGNDSALRTELRRAQQAKADLILLVLQNKNQDLYSTFKYLADKVFGIPTIVIVERSNFKKSVWNPLGLDAYIGNVMMKANLKMGGINHSAASKLKEMWLANTLVLGADVTHPTNGALPGCPSVAAVVGSVESTGGRFLGSMRLQTEGGKEASRYASVR